MAFDSNVDLDVSTPANDSNDIDKMHVYDMPPSGMVSAICNEEKMHEKAKTQQRQRWSRLELSSLPILSWPSIFWREGSQHQR